LISDVLFDAIVLIDIAALQQDLLNFLEQQAAIVKHLALFKEFTAPWN
jgi:hypothetical protein